MSVPWSYPLFRNYTNVLNLPLVHFQRQQQNAVAEMWSHELDAYISI